MAFLFLVTLAVMYSMSTFFISKSPMDSVSKRDSLLVLTISYFLVIMLFQHRHLEPSNNSQQTSLFKSFTLSQRYSVHPQFNELIQNNQKINFITLNLINFSTYETYKQIQENFIQDQNTLWIQKEFWKVPEAIKLITEEIQKGYLTIIIDYSDKGCETLIEFKFKYENKKNWPKIFMLNVNDNIGMCGQMLKRIHL